MATIYLLNKKNTVLLVPEAYKLCPELYDLTEDEVRFICLAFDYFSPYNQFPEIDRVVKARRHVWGNDDYKIDKATILHGIEAYKSLQYDYRREMVIKWKKKIFSLNETMMADDCSDKVITANLNSIKQFETKIKETETELLNSMEIEFDIKGGKKLSFLEKLMKNKEQYQEVIRKKA